MDKFIAMWLAISGISVVFAFICACLIKVYHLLYKKRSVKLAIGFGVLCAIGIVFFINYHYNPFFLYCALFMLYYHFWSDYSSDKKRAPSYTLLWCVAYSFLFTPIFMFAEANGWKLYLPLWQLQIALGFLAVLVAQLSVKSIYPEWLQETW